MLIVLPTLLYKSYKVMTMSVIDGFQQSNK